MGRARQRQHAIATAPRRSSELFAHTLGNGRGRTGARALLAGHSTPAAHAESARLLKQIRLDNFTESFELIQRAAALENGGFPAPLQALASALTDAALEIKMSTVDTQNRTRKVLKELGVRTGYCQHLVFDQNLALPDRKVHFALVPDRERGNHDDLLLACGETLKASEGMWMPSNRGDWFSAEDRGTFCCQGCAAIAEQHEESREGQPYPVLSESQHSAVTTAARTTMLAKLEEILEVREDVISELALYAYREALSDVAAHDLHTAGEWVFTALLDHKVYQALLDEGDRETLVGLLDEHDFREIAGAVIYDAFVDIPSSHGAYSRIAEAVRDRLAGRCYIAL